MANAIRFRLWSWLADTKSFSTEANKRLMQKKIQLSFKTANKFSIFVVSIPNMLDPILYLSHIMCSHPKWKHQAIIICWHYLIAPMQEFDQVSLSI